MVCQLRFHYALLTCVTFYIISFPDVTSGLLFRLVCPDNYTLDANRTRCVSTYGGRVGDAPLYVAVNEEFVLTRETSLFILGISVSVVSMIIIMLVRAVFRKGDSRWRERESTFVISRHVASPKYERLDSDSYKAMKVNSTFLLTGTPFYEADSTQRMIGMRGHIL